MLWGCLGWRHSQNYAAFEHEHTQSLIGHTNVNVTANTTDFVMRWLAAASGDP